MLLVSNAKPSENKDNPAFVIYSAPATSVASSRTASPSPGSEHSTSTRQVTEGRDNLAQPSRPSSDCPEHSGQRKAVEEDKVLQGGDDASHFLDGKRHVGEPVGQPPLKRSRSCTCTSQQPPQQGTHRPEVIKTRGHTEEPATNKSSSPSPEPLPKELPLLSLPPGTISSSTNG